MDKGVTRANSAAMRYFLDTEFNGFGGALISLALVPDHGQEFYVIVECDDPIHPWVERNVLPFLDHVPVGMKAEPMERRAAADALSAYLAPDRSPEIVADWPEDIAQLCMLLLTGPGDMVPIPEMVFRIYPMPGFSTADNSKVPHNALHDARSLRDHVCDTLE